ncbi:hypothetical protein Q8A73_004132 [Channa argus]|nr:hypothetical protein Q8A73_004132 [Channa argus]
MSWLIIGVGGRACHLELSLDTGLKSQPGLARESANVGVSHSPPPQRSPLPLAHRIDRALALCGLETRAGSALSAACSLDDYSGAAVTADASSHANQYTIFLSSLRLFGERQNNARPQHKRLIKSEVRGGETN